LAGKTHLAVGVFLLAAKDKEGYVKLQGGIPIAVASRRDGQHLRQKNRRRN
jgi:hypothetical protein